MHRDHRTIPDVSANRSYFACSQNFEQNLKTETNMGGGLGGVEGVYRRIEMTLKFEIKRGKRTGDDNQ